MAISSQSVQLFSATVTGGTAGTYSKLIDIKDFPDLIGEPNLLETTTLSDAQQTYINGIKKSELLKFSCNYDPTIFSTVKAMEGSTRAFKLTFSDGSNFTWQGSLSVGLPGKKVDEVVEFTINIAPSTAVSFSATSG